MKKKILIILPIIIVTCIIIFVIPKNSNIVETPQDAVETSEVSEPTQEPEKAPEPQPEVIEPETIEPEPETTKPEATETVESLDDGINSTHTDVELGEDEYQGDEATDGANINLNEEEQAAVNRIEENLKKKHPEWFTDTPSTGTGEGNYEHVGTPDNTENTPQFQFDPNDTEGLSKDVTVY